MSKAFITQLLERAVKTAAQSALALLAATQLDWFHADWEDIAGTIATATVASVLTSLCSMNICPTGTPSVVPIEKPAA